MKAIAYQSSLPIEHTDSLQDIERPIPQAFGHDLLIKIHAIAVNPVDCKIRQNVPASEGEYKVIGWDAVGEVIACGEQVSLFSVGDNVYYAGDLTRSGCNAEFQLVDERIVGRKPNTLNNAEAAALPLTTITAYEMLFDRLQVRKVNSATAKQTANERILVVGAAGGVGSIMLQLLKHLTKATVIATASRVSSKQWVKDLGADFVVDHTQPLAPQVLALELGEMTHVVSLNGTDQYLDEYVEVLQPFGKLGLIDDPENVDIKKLKRKSLSLHWEFMYTRSMFNTADMIEQHNLLNEIANLVDNGVIKTTLSETLGKINSANLKKAHSLIESRKAMGKLVLEGF